MFRTQPQNALGIAPYAIIIFRMTLDRLWHLCSPAGPYRHAKSLCHISPEGSHGSLGRLGVLRRPADCPRVAGARLHQPHWWTSINMKQRKIERKSNIENQKEDIIIYIIYLQHLKPRNLAGKWK